MPETRLTSADLTYVRTRRVKGGQVSDFSILELGPHCCCHVHDDKAEWFAAQLRLAADAIAAHAGVATRRVITAQATSGTVERKLGMRVEP